MNRLPVLFAGALLVLGVVAVCFAEPGPGGKGKGKGKGPRFGQGPDAAHRTDMELFHFLLDHRQEISRQVKNLPDGVETVTESRNPSVVAKLQAHVESMYRRVETGRPIHARDPLFAEIFRNAEKINFGLEKTPNGVRVIETSEDPYVARLIQSHAEVVNRFLKNGHRELMQNHPLPAR